MNFNNVKQGAGCALAGIAYPLMMFLGAAIHIWTVVIAFAAKGLFGGILSLMFPVLAQFFWGFWAWNVTGTFANLYCQALAAYVGLWILIIVGIMLSGSGDR